MVKTAAKVIMMTWGEVIHIPMDHDTPHVVRSKGYLEDALEARVEGV